MAFQSVNTELTESRSFVDPSFPMHMSVDQILSWCKGTWQHSSHHFVICTDIPMAQKSPFCDLHGNSYFMICMDIPMSWPAQMSPCHDLTAVQSFSNSGLESPEHQGDLALRFLADVKFKSLQPNNWLLLVDGKGTNGFLEKNIHWHLYHSASYHFLMQLQ